MHKAAPILSKVISSDFDQTHFASDIKGALNSVESGVGHSSEQVFRWMDDWADGKKHPVPAPDILPDA